MNRWGSFSPTLMLWLKNIRIIVPDIPSLEIRCSKFVLFWGSFIQYNYLKDKELIAENGDQTLYLLIAEGDTKAFSRAHTLYKTQLLSYARSYLTEWGEVQDVVSETFIALWKWREHVRSNVHLRNFLFMTVRNKAINYLVAKKRYDNLLARASEGIGNIHTIDPEEVEVALLHQLRAAVKALPADYRRI